MATLYDTFQNAADIVFKVFSSLVKTVTYTSVFDDGFNQTTEDYELHMIQAVFEERDTQFLSFSNLIQPTDIKGLIRGEEIREVGLTELTTSDIIQIQNSDIRYTVVAWDTDPAQALYIFLLRRASGRP